MANVNQAMDEMGIPMLELRPPINFDEVQAMSDEEVENFRDVRGYNLLMLASEVGHIEAVNNLIERGEDVNFEVDTECAASLAFTRGHHQVVLTLLKANAKIPNNFNEETASDELKAFINLSEVMHERISGANEADEVGFEATKNFLRDKIEEIPSVRHFYDKSNVSLLKRAALCSMFGIYKLLLTLNIFFAPHENLEDIFDELEYSDRRKLREITFEVCPNLLTEDLMILMRNCKLGPDTPEDRHGEFMNYIYDAFRALFQVQSLAVVLRVVAASFDFKIVFDFKRDSIQFLDPSSEPYVEGLCYLTGRIYIAAQDLLDPSTAFNIVGVIAHELCHYAMFLVYGNVARPYKVKNVRNARRFELISQECERLKESEALIKVVYDCYDEEAQHAELIVRPCHMRGLYLNAVEILNEKMEIFADLFNYFDEVCVREMEAAIPKIQRKFNPFKKAQRKVQIQTRIIFTLVISLLLGAALSVWGWFELRPVAWSELSLEDQKLFKNASVNFHGVDVKFGEIFANDSNVYNLLSSEQIKRRLKNETKELSNAIEQTYDNFVFLKFSNMTKELKEKFVEFEANFQGQNVSLKSLTNNETNFELLNSSQVKEIFKGSQLKVSKATEINSKFVIERFFINEHEKIIEEHYENGRVNSNHKDIKSFTKIVENLKQGKVFLLSSVAGEGKSTTFRHFSLKLKEKFPTKWIQFVDLKKHSEAYEKNKNLNFSIEENLLNFLSHDLLKLEGFELKVFSELFQSGNLIFLFDGIDEVAPIYKDFMIHLTTSIKSKTENFQFVSTRPQHSKEFQEKLKVKAQKFVPLGSLESFELCIKFIAYEKFNVDGNEIVKIFNEESFSNRTFVNIEEFKKKMVKINLSPKISSKIHSEIEKSFKILKSIKINSGIIKNPLLIRLIAEMSSEDFEVNANASLNLYKLYKIFIDKKLKIVNEEKGDIVSQDARNIQASSTFNLIQVHQAYAIKLFVIGAVTFDGDIYDGFTLYYSKYYGKIYSINNLQIMKSIGKVSKEEISRFGILQVYSQENFDFVHRTFAEYFVAQYVIDTLRTSEDHSSPDQGNTLIFINLLSVGNLEGARNFFYNFLESETEQKISHSLLFSYLTALDSHNRTIVHKYFATSIDGFNSFLSLLSKNLDSSQLASLFLMEDQNNANVLAYALRKINNKQLKILWKFIEEKLFESDQKKLLVMEENSCGNALYYSGFNREKEVFPNVLKIFTNNNFTDEEIQKLLMKSDLSCPTILFGLIRSSEHSTIQKLVKYFEIALQKNKEDLKMFFLHRDIYNFTIFHQYYKEDFEKIAFPFKDILKKTFDDKFFLGILRTYSKVFNFFQQSSLPKDLSELRKFFWNSLDFDFVVNDWENLNERLGYERFKTLLLSKDEYGESLLFDIARLNENESLLQTFLTNAKKILNKKEFLELSEKSNSKRTPLMYAAREKNEENLKIFWVFFEKTFYENVTKEILAAKGEDLHTALQFSTWNKDSKSFLFVKEIYEKYFTPKEIRKILMEVRRNNISFVYFTIEYNDFNGCQVVANYLKELFTNEKNHLLEILYHEDKNGDTIFSYFKNKEKYQNKLKIFEELLQTLSIVEGN